MKSEIESVKITYADKLNENRSNARNVGSSDSGTTTGSNAWQTASRGRNSRRSYYGTSTGSQGGISMGAPLPSRFVVLERINKEITKENVKKHMESRKT